MSFQNFAFNHLVSCQRLRKRRQTESYGVCAPEGADDGAVNPPAPPSTSFGLRRTHVLATHLFNALPGFDLYIS